MSGTKTLWTKRTTANGIFYKVIAFDLYNETKCYRHGINRALNWRRLYQVYNKYRGLEENLPTVLVQARLLFGEYYQVRLTCFVLSSLRLFDARKQRLTYAIDR